MERKEREKKKTTTEAVIASANNLRDELRMAPPPPPALLVLPESRRFAIFGGFGRERLSHSLQLRPSILVNIIILCSALLTVKTRIRRVRVGGAY